MRPYAAQELKKPQPVLRKSGVGQARPKPREEGETMSNDEWARRSVRALLRRLLTQLAVASEQAAKEFRAGLR